MAVLIPRIKSDLHRNIVAVFNENGVQIMTPSYMADPPEPKIPTEDWDGHLGARNHKDEYGKITLGVFTTGATPCLSDGA